MHQKPRGEHSCPPFRLGFFLPSFCGDPEWLPASTPPEQSPFLPCACCRFEPLHGGLTAPHRCLCLASTEAAPRPLSALSWAPWACLGGQGVGWAGSVLPGPCYLGGTDPAGPGAVATALSWRVTLTVWLGQQLGNACQNSSLLHFTSCLILFPFCL